MPPHFNLQIAGRWKIRRNYWFRYLSYDKESQIIRQECSLTDASDIAKYLNHNQMDRPKIIQSRSAPNSTSLPVINLIYKETSNSSQKISDNANSTLEPTRLTTPIITTIIISILISLLGLILLLWWRRKKAKDSENSNVGKEETIEGRSLSLDSSLLDHNRMSVDSSGRYTSKKLSTETYDTPIPDIEKELVFEPPLNNHPAYKFLDVNNPGPPHPGTRVIVPEIPSPLPSPVSDRETLSKRRYSNTPTSVAAINKHQFNSDSPARSSKPSNSDSSSDNVCEDPGSESELFTSPFVLEKDYRNQCEIIKEETDEGSTQEDSMKLEKSLETATHPWHQLFSRITWSGSPDIKIKDINQGANTSSGIYRKKSAAAIPDTSDQVHLMSDRWSRSTLELPESPNLSSDCYIPGSWLNPLSLDDDDIKASEKANK